MTLEQRLEEQILDPHQNCGHPQINMQMLGMRPGSGQMWGLIRNEEPWGWERRGGRGSGGQASVYAGSLHSQQENRGQEQWGF